MSNRIMAPFERILTTTVNDIEHTESTSMYGMGIIKIYFQPTVDIRTAATAQVSAISQPAIRQMPAGTTPPLVINYNASTVPVLQLATSSRVLSEQQVLDLTQNFVRPQLTTVRGAAITFPTGGRQRQIMVDLDPQAMQTYGLSATDVQNALAAQNQITPVGTTKIGSFQYHDTAQQRRADRRRSQQLAGQDGGRRHHLHARRRPCPRRLSGPVQHCACRWRPCRAFHHHEERLGLHPRCGAGRL